MMPHRSLQASDLLLHIIPDDALRQSHVDFASDYVRDEVLKRLMIYSKQDLALFLNGVNPYLPKDAFRGLIAAHGAHHVLQINLYQKKEYARLEATWPMMREHAYVIADALTTALVKQFPTEFS